MIALVVSACFLSDPSLCRTFRVPVPDQTDLIACAMSAAPYLPQWAEEHPGWQINKWSCAGSDIADL
jgi:hypothetical protein